MKEKEEIEDIPIVSPYILNDFKAELDSFEQNEKIAQGQLEEI